MKKIGHLETFILILIIIQFPLFVRAQGTATDPDSSAAGTVPDSTVRPDPSAVSTTPTAPQSTPKVPPKAVVPTLTPMPMVIDTTPDTLPITTTNDESRNVIVATLSAAGAAVLLFFGVNIRKKKTEDKKNDKKCLNIKKLMEEKLSEVTNLKSHLANIAKEEATKQVKNMAAGKKAGELLAFAEKRKEEYEKLKELYQKCITELGKKKYQGVIIEESLDSKKILNKVTVIKTKIEPITEKHKTPWLGQWTLHNVEIDEEDAQKIAEDISKDLDKHNSWYADFKNENYHFIIYRGKIFKVDLKNPTLYKDAKQYGIALGIPEYQVDFAPDDKVWER